MYNPCPILIIDNICLILKKKKKQPNKQKHTWGPRERGKEKAGVRESSNCFSGKME